MENQTFQKPRKLSQKLLQALLNDKVKFVHWKGSHNLEEGLNGESDIELLIDPDYRQKFEMIAQKLDFKKAISPPWNRIHQVEDWIGYDPAIGNLIHLHTHYSIVSGIPFVKYLYLPWSNSLLDNQIIDKKTGWPIPRPELETILLLIRIWAKLPWHDRIKNPIKIPQKRLNELEKLLSQSSFDRLIGTCELLNLKVPANFELAVQKIIQLKDCKEVAELSFHFYQQTKQHQRLPYYLAQFKSYYFKYHLRFLNSFSRLLSPLIIKKRIINGGIKIALIGCDGAGKSTLSKDLIKWLTVKLDTHYFYLGKKPHIHSHDKKLLSLIYYFFEDNKLSKITRRLFRGLYNLLLTQKKISLLKEADQLTKNGSLIIFDRFPQHQFPGINDGPKLQNGPPTLISKKELLLFEKISSLEPDIIFRLNITPELAWERKPAFDKAIIREKCEKIGKLTFKKAKIIEIDASKPYSQVLFQIKSEIWKNLK